MGYYKRSLITLRWYPHKKVLMILWPSLPNLFQIKLKSKHTLQFKASKYLCLHRNLNNKIQWFRLSNKLYLHIRFSFSRNLMKVIQHLHMSFFRIQWLGWMLLPKGFLSYQRHGCSWMGIGLIFRIKLYKILSS